MSWRCVAAGVALLALAGCGEQTRSATATDPKPTTGASSAGPLLVVDGEVQVACGSGSASGWSPSVMPHGLDGLITDAEVDRTFSDAWHDEEGLGVELPFIGTLEDFTSMEWRVLYGDEDSVLLGTGRWTVGGPRGSDLTYTLRRDGDAWTLAGMGSCRLQPALDPAYSWARASRPDGGLERQSRTVTVGVTEMACSSARDPSNFIQEPYLQETEESVTVYLTTTAPEGMNACPGRPPVPYELTLAEPLGDRALLDGSTYPATPVGAPLF